MNKIVKISILFSSVFLLAFVLIPDNEDLKQKADQLFKEKKYVEAYPLYGQLISLYSKDPNYSYRYGACMLFVEKDKEKPLKYLKYGASKPNVNYEAYYFLAKAYHLNYNFDKAIKYYEKYKSKATNAEIKDYEVVRSIEMCRNGQKLLSNITDIGVLEKKEVKRSEFFRSYHLDGIGGKIIVKPDEFKSKYDLKVNEYSIIYLNDNPTTVLYSSYGKDGSTGKDIYKVVKLPNGEWSKPSKLEGPINTPYDEDYPFLHPDGRTLYFCSKGHNSMGGYDVFRSYYDEGTGTWSTPENLDFAINSTNDDILFISDKDNLLAYFASNRESKYGEITVYKVQVEKGRLNMQLLKVNLLLNLIRTKKMLKLQL
jgi:tetratricopeptide (TPR) repeat protein